MKKLFLMPLALLAFSVASAQTDNRTGNTTQTDKDKSTIITQDQTKSTTTQEARKGNKKSKKTTNTSSTRTTRETGNRNTNSTERIGTNSNGQDQNAPATGRNNSTVPAPSK